MGIFNRTTKVETVHRIELDDEVRQSLVNLEAELQTLEELIREVTSQGRDILSRLHGQALTAVNTGDDELPSRDVAEGETWRSRVTGNVTVEDHERVRSSPFNRVPRHEQVAWLLDYMSVGVWYHPHEIAREHSGDEREFRYLRSAVSGRLREMCDEGIVERAPSTAKGSMFRYMKIPGRS
jgi:hypothetical protein